MNIYAMFRANEKQIPFWVSKWKSQVLRVTEIEAFRGGPPYYGNPPVSGEIFSIYRTRPSPPSHTAPTRSTYADERTDTYRKIEEREVSAGTFNWVWMEPDDAKIVLLGSKFPR